MLTCLPMSVFQLLLLIFLLLPVAEIYVLIKVGSVIGAVPTVALVVFTAVLGASLMRSQGLATLAKVKHSLDQGELPAGTLLEGAIILLAGALLLTPGFITDTIGFVCLVPPWRQRLVRWLLARHVFVSGKHDGGDHGRRPGGGGEVIEGEYRREDD